MRYVENGVREDFAKLTFKGLNVGTVNSFAQISSDILAEV